MCRMSWNMGGSTSRNPQRLYRDCFTFTFTLTFAFTCTWLVYIWWQLVAITRIILIVQINYSPADGSALYLRTGKNSYTDFIVLHVSTHAQSCYHPQWRQYMKNVVMGSPPPPSLTYLHHKSKSHLRIVYLVSKCCEIFIIVNECPPVFTVTTMHIVIHSIARTTVVLNHLKYPVFWTPALKCNPRILRERERARERERERERERGAFFLPSCKHMQLMDLHFLQRWDVILLPLSWPTSEHGNICLLKPIFNWRPPNSRQFPKPF